VLDVLSDVDSEHEYDIEDSLSSDESDPEFNEVSDSYSEIIASELNITLPELDIDSIVCTRYDSFARLQYVKVQWYTAVHRKNADHSQPVAQYRFYFIKPYKNF